MSLTSWLIALAPFAALILTLLGGRYPGERVLERLRRRRYPRRTLARIPRPRWEPRTRRRSGELLATALASRGPPVPAP